MEEVGLTSEQIKEYNEFSKELVSKILELKENLSEQYGISQEDVNVRFDFEVGNQTIVFPCDLYLHYFVYRNNELIDSFRFWAFADPETKMFNEVDAYQHILTKLNSGEYKTTDFILNVNMDTDTRSTFDILYLNDFLYQVQSEGESVLLNWEEVSARDLFSS